VLECVLNVSEGRRPAVLTALAAAAGHHLLDVHADPHHHRAVLTLAGPDVEDAALVVAAVAVATIDLSTHRGVHPRLGAVDVVPFVPLAGSDSGDALAARDRFAQRAATELDLPCFLYGPERTLPDVRRHAFRALPPDAGPSRPHPTAGATCVGARPVLVAYNLWLAPPAGLELANAVVRRLRGPGVQALAFDLAGAVQVSCNLLDPERVGPAAVFDAVAREVEVARAELVGLVPARLLERTPGHRWAELDLDPSRTIEARLEQAGLDGGSPRRQEPV
jgi:glutamate formiminotransferase